MMLGNRFPMLPSSWRWAALALGTFTLAGCGPAAPEPGPVAAGTARALVRPWVARNALVAPAARDPVTGVSVAPGPTAVVLGYRAPDGTLRVGCVDSEDGAEALVRGTDDDR